MTPEISARLEESRAQILEALGSFSRLTFLRAWGNRGDDLILAGTRSFLSGLPYREYSLRDLDRVPRGGTAIVSGGGGFCKAFHKMPDLAREVERRFERTVILPSTFDIGEPSVRAFLSGTRAIVFARERKSYEQIRDLCDARLAYDMAFFFNFEPYKSGYSQGTLQAFRLDKEAAGWSIPEGNRDISGECASMDEWLWEIGHHDLIRTDRAHVVIAAAMLGKRVEYRSSNYHKIPAIVEYSLFSPDLVQALPVETAPAPRRGPGWFGRRFGWFGS